MAQDDESRDIIRREAAEAAKGARLQRMRAISLLLDAAEKSPHAHIWCAVEHREDVYLRQAEIGRSADATELLEQDKNTSGTLTCASSDVLNTLVSFLDSYIETGNSINAFFGFYTPAQIGKERQSDTTRKLSIDLPDKPILESLSNGVIEPNTLAAIKRFALAEYRAQYKDRLTRSHFDTIERWTNDQWLAFLARIAWKFGQEDDVALKASLLRRIRTHQRFGPIDAGEELVFAMLMEKLDERQRSPDLTIKLIHAAEVALTFRDVTSAGTRVVEQPERILHVPHLRNQSFSGRSAEMGELRRSLVDTRGGLVALTGLGGIGKTQLALEYSYSHVNEYRVIWWIRAEEPGQVAAGLARLCRALELQGADDAREAATRAKAWLERHSDWLLVLDNVVSPLSIFEFLPRAHSGHILLTSRRQEWPGEVHVLPLTVMSLDDAARFVQAATASENRDGATSLATELDRLPLALAQASAFIRRRKTSFREFLELFRSRRKDILARLHPEPNYEATLATTWDVSFEAVKGESAEAARLIEHCAFLAPDAIPLDLFTKGAAFLDRTLQSVASDDLRLGDIAAVLHDYSLATLESRTLSIHRLVQAATRDRMDEPSRVATATTSVEVLNVS